MIKFFQKFEGLKLKEKLIKTKTFSPKGYRPI